MERAVTFSYSVGDFVADKHWSSRLKYGSKNNSLFECEHTRSDTSTKRIGDLEIVQIFINLSSMQQNEVSAIYIISANSECKEKCKNESNDDHP